MLVLLSKEIRSFFTSLTGYIVIIVFLLANSAFLWLFPGDMNILDTGYATLDSFFSFAPWVFLFLVPAITMRSFAEENKSGTMEFLLTKPITDLQLVLAKYLGSLILVMFALIPCFIYFYTVWVLGNPAGNMDTGGTWGAFIGLFLLAAIYTSTGVFASAMSDNQIVAFIIALFLSFFLYQGFDFIAGIPGLQALDTVVLNLGINEHYKSISRGVIDSRDIIYYFVVIALFILFTKTRLQSRKW
jgi:ABC-2 type transport system permease protein